MRTDITCTLNGISLHALDDRIYVEDIKETPNTNMETANRYGYGTFPMADPERTSLTIKVTVFVKERDRTERQTVIDKIKGWCGEGYFTKNTKPGKQIYVFCTKMPEEETFDLTHRLEIEFTAYGEAFWQEVTPKTVSNSSAAQAFVTTITPNGTQDCFLEATITPSEGTLTSVKITVGSQKLTLTGLSVSATKTLQIYYDNLHILKIESGGTSLLSKRSADSVDDIILTAGLNNDVQLEFDTACTFIITARGLWK